MFTNLDAAAMELAFTQAGVLTRRQALALGFSSRMIVSRALSGQWKRAAVGVYTLYPTSSRRLPLAIAVAKLAATVSHESAAELHGLLRPRAGRWVVTVPHRTTNQCPDVVVHESTDLAPDHIVLLDGLPVTTPARTLIDLAAVLREDRLERVVHGAVVARTVDVAGLRDCFDGVARRGKPGVAALRRILADLQGGAIVVESELERRLLTLLRSANLPEPECQYSLPWRPSSSGRVDFAFPDSKLIVECDGRRWHTSVESFEFDRRRDNLAQLAGWRVLRFTWADVVERPSYVVQAVRSAVFATPAA